MILKRFAKTKSPALGFLMGLCVATPILAQSADPNHNLPASYLCKEQVQRIGPGLDALLANTNPDESFRVSYQAMVAANLIRQACEETPEDNPYDLQTDEIEISFQTEMAANTVAKCQAVGPDLLKQLENVSAEVTRSPQRASNTVSALERVINVSADLCPDTMTDAFGQLSSAADRLQEATRLWPECDAEREAFSTTIDELSEKLQYPENDPAVLDAEILTPALAQIEDKCGFDEGWLGGVDKSETQVRVLMAERTAEARKACQTGLLAIEESFESIDARNAAFQPGCDEHYKLEAGHRDSKRAIETVLNSTCQLFPAVTSKPQARYERQMRLVKELYAEHKSLEYRVEQEGEGILSCEP